MGTRFSEIKGKIRFASSPPSDPQTGDEYWDSTKKSWFRYSGNNWLGVRTWSTTSTSTTTTTSTSTSTSTTTTSTSSSTSTSTSTSTTTTG